MDKFIVKNQVLTNIVQMLESDGSFTDVAYVAISEMQKYLGASHAGIVQISEDKAEIQTVVSYNEAGQSVFPINKLNRKLFVFETGDVLYTTVDNATITQKEFMNEYGIKTSITVPIYINSVCSMYLWIMDLNECLYYDDEVMQFVRDVATIIQSIAQKKITNGSLVSSYEVLREVLGTIGIGIMVFSYEDASIFFENDIAKESEEVRRTMIECVREYIKDKPNRKKGIKRPIEYYDSESGLWFEIKFADLNWVDGSAVLVCTAVDVTQKKKNQQRIEYQANNDFLTGLYNRMKCESDIGVVIADALSKNKSGAIMFIDLDDFKHINDGLGHQYGDILLQQIAAGLQGIPGLRGNCYRMGGDEFLVIVKPELYPDMQRVIKNVLAMFNKPWYLMGTEYFCTMSMGIAVYPDNSRDVHELVKMADMAMYEAKKSGKNRCNFYDGSTSRNTIKRLDIENNMRQAIASEIKEFVVFYQPVVDAKTKKCTSCEALVRWNSKALGFMGPREFIPLAEYLGLITDIGDYVLEEACLQCKKWNDAGYKDFHINVNLSVVQLLQKNVVENIGRIFARTGVNPHNIVLEITESFAINDMERVMKIIAGLKLLGPRIALDDFGTGYSSLNYIKQLPLNIIKVDKTFIDDILEDEYAQAFVKLIVDLSKTIGTQIVVEGVEYVEQYELLKDLGVNFIQGFLFGKPMSAEDFEKEHLMNSR